VLVQVEQIAPVSSTVLIEGEKWHRQGAGGARHTPAVATPQQTIHRRECGRFARDAFGKRVSSGTRRARSPARPNDASGGSSWRTSGTLFLDEIGEIPPSTQVKLLRVLEERAVTRVGGTTETPIDVRVVAATNAPLRDGVEQGRFSCRPVLPSQRVADLPAAAA
jgi:transcriptional regulator of acetoin/glycerol metabolism